jgi:hypothetical protein
VHSVSLSQAVTCGQQLCSPQVSHAESSALGAQAAPPPLLEPELLPEHCDEQLSSTHVPKFVASWLSATHSSHAAPASSQVVMHARQVESDLHVVAWVQQCWARHVPQADVSVMTGQDACEQLLLEDVEPPPKDPPSDPVPVELQLLLLLLDEHPTIASVATAAHVWMKRMTGFIGNSPGWRCDATRPYSTHQGRPQRALPGRSPGRRVDSGTSSRDARSMTPPGRAGPRARARVPSPGALRARVPLAPHVLDDSPLLGARREGIFICGSPEVV